MKRVAMAAAAALAWGVGSAAAQPTPGVLVGTDWVARHLDDPSVVVLHAEMRRDRYESAHLPGARFLDMTGLVWDGDPPWSTEMRDAASVREALEAAGVRDGQHVVVYAGNALHAARAFMTLEVMGLRGRVSMMDGGLGGWRDEGRPVTAEVPRVARGSVTLSPRDDVLVSAEWILERLDRPDVALVDARPADEYSGADGGMGGMANPGHIPGAAFMYWEELVESREAPRVLPRERLARLFAEADADEGDTVVAYCMVGWRASFTYFASRLLGYETKFYDPSWHEWGSRDDLPYVSGMSRR